MPSDTITCPECNQRVPAPNLNVGVINEPDISIVHCVHVTGVDCPCGAYLKPMVVNLPPGVFAWVSIERPVESRVITPNLVLAH